MPGLHRVFGQNLFICVYGYPLFSLLFFFPSLFLLLQLGKDGSIEIKEEYYYIFFGRDECHLGRILGYGTEFFFCCYAISASYRSSNADLSIGSGFPIDSHNGL